MDMHYVFMKSNGMTKKNQFPTNKYEIGAMICPINHLECC